MGKYKVCVYAICKNEERFVEKWMKSMNEADEVYVLDTGSEDNTVKKLREYGAKVTIKKISPWRFDVARNESLKLVPKDADICVCTDLDEVLCRGWREKLEEAWSPDTNQGRYLYNWSLKEDGTPNVQFPYFKIHTRNEFVWTYPVHEVLTYIGNRVYKPVFIEGLVLNHYPDVSKSRGSYLPLLELAVEENPKDDRMNYYLGREYMYKGKWDDSIKTLVNYLALEKAVWKEERCAAMRWIARCYANKNDYKSAYSWYYRALGECSKMREPFVEFSRVAYEIKDWRTCFYMVTEALNITEKSSLYVNEGYCWDATPYDLAGISAYYLGMYKSSYEYAKQALAFAPDDERLQLNVKLAEEKCKTE